MSKITGMLPKLETGMVVVTPISLANITPNKKYVVQSIDEGYLLIRNDRDEVASYSTYQFIEADLYFTMCLFSSIIALFNLGSNAYK